MQKTALFIASTLDGFIAGKKDDISWLDEFNEPGIDYGYNNFIKKVRTVVMGRKTYDVYKKGAEKPDMKQKVYVLTSNKDLQPKDANTVIWTKGFKALVKELAKVKSGVIWPVGGGKLIGEFINAGFVDEYILFVMPLLLGDGVRLFDGVEGIKKLKLKESKAYKNGVLMIRYNKKTS
jgi:dihydrofolate reductase